MEPKETRIVISLTTRNKLDVLEVEDGVEEIHKVKEVEQEIKKEEKKQNTNK